MPGGRAGRRWHQAARPRTGHRATARGRSCGVPAPRRRRISASGDRGDSRHQRGHVEISGPQSPAPPAGAPDGGLMNCEQCTEWFGDAVDGTLSPERRAQVDAHCRDCESVPPPAERLEGNPRSGVLDSRGSLLRPDVWDAIAQEVRRPRRPHRWRRGLYRLLALGCAGSRRALVMMLGTAAWLSVSASWRSWRRRIGGRARARGRIGAAARRAALSQCHRVARTADRQQGERAGAGGRRRHRAEPAVDRPRD